MGEYEIYFNTIPARRGCIGILIQGVGFLLHTLFVSSCVRVGFLATKATCNPCKIFIFPEAIISKEFTLKFLLHFQLKKSQTQK